jgi:FtsP/CotA-like multicopper oxidase with cupredoxin domain
MQRLADTWNQARPAIVARRPEEARSGLRTKEEGMMKSAGTVFLVLVAAILSTGSQSFAQIPGGSLDPTTVPKYVEDLIIPPVMPAAGQITVRGTGRIDTYEIEVVQFDQQILPTGFPQTTVWSYAALGRPETRNYPAFTVETKSNRPTRVRWINNLVDGSGNFLPHLLAVDQTAHWANPPQVCREGASRTDCAGTSQDPYLGPVPMVTHVHGAHVGPESDGYPEAWWLPAANNIPPSFATEGSLFGEFVDSAATAGDAIFQYPNDQPEATLWYHDHTLGMTRLNVYAGPAGFWLIRGGDQEEFLNLPGPAPKKNSFKNLKGKKFFEIPIVIQDRSFDDDGSLFYPDNRAFFEGLVPDQLDIDFAPDSDVLPIWNPEAFFNTMVVNGRTWPKLDVEPRRYRFRLLNGCNSRFLNLALFVENPDGTLSSVELPFFQIGAEQGLLPNVVEIRTGQTTVLPGGGLPGTPVPADSAEQALLMAPAERADVIVDFAGLAPGTKVRMINTGSDAPFAGFPIDEGDLADPGTTGQVMQFVVGALSDPDPSTAPQDLVLAPVPPLVSDNTRQVSLNEEESAVVCVEEQPDGSLVQVPGSVPPECAAGGEVFGPTAALLGTLDDQGAGVPLLWGNAITENPALGSTETWEIFNFTADAHPIHIHLVGFQVVDREIFGGTPVAPQPWELGLKDTVIAFPGEITRVRATFDIPGLYVWHCHIVEHEDNEMMRPYCVGDLANCPANVIP